MSAPVSTASPTTLLGLALVVVLAACGSEATSGSDATSADATEDGEPGDGDGEPGDGDGEPGDGDGEPGDGDGEPGDGDGDGDPGDGEPGDGDGDPGDGDPGDGDGDPGDGDGDGGPECTFNRDCEADMVCVLGDRNFDNQFEPLCSPCLTCRDTKFDPNSPIPAWVKCNDDADCCDQPSYGGAGTCLAGVCSYPQPC